MKFFSAIIMLLILGTFCFANASETTGTGTGTVNVTVEKKDIEIISGTQAIINLNIEPGETSEEQSYLWTFTGSPGFTCNAKYTWEYNGFDNLFTINPTESKIIDLAIFEEVEGVNDPTTGAADFDYYFTVYCKPGTDDKTYSLTLTVTVDY